jgi:hypothetical protein
MGKAVLFVGMKREREALAIELVVSAQHYGTD